MPSSQAAKRSLTSSLTDVTRTKTDGITTTVFCTPDGQTSLVIQKWALPLMGKSRS